MEVIDPLGARSRTLKQTRAVRLAWLAAACVDHVTDLPVTGGLRAMAWPAGNPSAAVAGALTGSRIFAFGRLPGLPAVTPGGGSGAPLPPAPFVVQITDPQGRFLPAAVSVQAPLTAPSPAFPWLAGDGTGQFTLFSSPGRSPDAGQAAVRGTLWDGSRQQPAAHAVLRLVTPAGTWFGVADGRGCVAVLFPFPTLSASAGLASGPPGLFAARAVTISVQYGGAALPIPPGAVAPDLLAILGQPQAQICDTAPDEPAVSCQRSVLYGQDLILRSQCAGDQGYLFVTPRAPQIH